MYCSHPIVVTQSKL